MIDWEVKEITACQLNKKKKVLCDTQLNKKKKGLCGTQLNKRKRACVIPKTEKNSVRDSQREG